MIRLVIGHRGDDRASDPAAVLYCGHDADAAQFSIDAAPEGFTRIETATVPHLLRARRSRNAVLPAVEIVPDDRDGDIMAALAQIKELEGGLIRAHAHNEDLVAEVARLCAVNSNQGERIAELEFLAQTQSATITGLEQASPVASELGQGAASEMDICAAAAGAVPEITASEDGPSLDLSGGSQEPPQPAKQPRQYKLK